MLLLLQMMQRLILVGSLLTLVVVTVDAIDNRKFLLLNRLLRDTRDVAQATGVHRRMNPSVCIRTVYRLLGLFLIKMHRVGLHAVTLNVGFLIFRK